MSDTVSWSLNVSRETDSRLRAHLAQEGLREEDLPKFVEEAVRWKVFEDTVLRVKSRNTRVPAEHIEAVINEALETVRAERPHSSK
jgi:hypothetical protein